MSDLARQFAKAKLNALPSSPPTHAAIPSTSQEATSPIDEDSSSASSMSSTGTVRPSSSQKPAAPVRWSDFFAQELWIETTFAAPAPAPPGGSNDNGGESSAGAGAGSMAAPPRPQSGAAAPAEAPHQTGLTQRAKYHAYATPPATPSSQLLILHHGAGSSALTFALFAREVRRVMPDVGIVAVDAREHGSVVYAPDADNGGDGRRGGGPGPERDTDLSLRNLAADFVRMVPLVLDRLGVPSGARMPATVLVGHSLGGAVVTDVCARGGLGPAVLGFAVVDVVEGSAVEALASMNSYLATRPRVFASLDEAVGWHVRSRTVRNVESARASVPGVLVKVDGEDEDASGDGGPWRWKTGLERTQSYWWDWFEGMSGKFLRAKGAKLLLLAGTDRLDKELMIGQMQGKFQLQVFPDAGHFVQEDLPQRTAELIVEFLKRNDRSTLVLPPKVSDLLAQGKKV
ncbi:Alpha/Beta hydrolase protein [Lineolata rhizophorae]|uniref:Protein phosphatase methylesterase 1 n=1 Tax=Lineolata rhizophorae TaxID=578093 RepID=A0A6A6P7Y4_9PEZI|nr:Alpha/Beta hydrolase protein [Lineolata rhizophorae]